MATTRIKTGTPAKRGAKVDPQKVAKILGTNPKGIDSGMLLNALIEEWGGAPKFAKAIYSEFDAAPDGSMTRTKILEMISRLTIVVTSQEIAKPKRAEDMTDEELQEAAAGLMRRVSDASATAA